MNKQWEITKQFDFCYGHRVWSQQLHEEYSIDSACACRHFHGHQGTILVSLVSDREGDQLERGMVTDFKHLNWFKRFVDDVLDHKMILDINDPLVKTGHIFSGINYDTIKNNTIYHNEGYLILNPDFINQFENLAIREYYEGIVFVQFVPTSENLSAWLAEIVDKKMRPLGVKVSVIKFFETPKSSAVVKLN